MEGISAFLGICVYHPIIGLFDTIVRLSFVSERDRIPHEEFAEACARPFLFRDIGGAVPSHTDPHAFSDVQFQFASHTNPHAFFQHR